MQIWSDIKSNLNNVYMKTYPLCKSGCCILAELLYVLYKQLQMQINLLLIFLITCYFYNPTLMDDILILLLQEKKYNAVVEVEQTNSTIEPKIQSALTKPTEVTTPKLIIVGGIIVTLALGVLLEHYMKVI